MVKLNPTLKAATLIESLVAMVVVATCLGIATMVHVNVLNSDHQRKKTKANLILNHEASEIKTQKMFVDGERVLGEWTIKRSVEKYEGTENLYKLSLSVIDQDKKIITVRNELITVEE